MRKTSPGASPSPAHLETQLGELAARVESRLDDFRRRRVAERLWRRDTTIWSADPNTPELADRFGWLDIGAKMAAQSASLAAFADEIRTAFDRIVLCGMGGSSLAPEVLRRSFGRRDGYPALTVLDSTHPQAIAGVAGDDVVETTLFVISSKSGTTRETMSLYRHYWELAGRRGSQFVAITDPDTPLASLAAERAFRRTFLNPPDIGGRYSALSHFGLVPGASIGVDVGELLRSAQRMVDGCAAGVSERENPGMWLGAALGEAALAAKDKLTFVLSPPLSAFGLWVEQLVAESTGKHGTGLIPVVGEPLGPPDVYGSDRVFVAIDLAGNVDDAVLARLDALAAAGHPVLRVALGDATDLGAEFFRWEFATAVAGAVLQINPFDQPNVAESKRNTDQMLAGRPSSGQSSPPPSTGPEALEALLAGVGPGDYVALLAYLPPAPDTERRLERIQVALRDRLRVPVTVGYGPRYLHSTGQLHKGGPSTGHYIQIVDPVTDDMPIPGERFTFGELRDAQADGDLQALKGRGRPIVRLGDLEPLER